MARFAAVSCQIAAVEDDIDFWGGFSECRVVGGGVQVEVVGV